MVGHALGLYVSLRQIAQGPIQKEGVIEGRGCFEYISRKERLWFNGDYCLNGVVGIGISEQCNA